MSTDSRQATLHVAAMPFPAARGTQALVHSIVEAVAASGDDTHLITYGPGKSDNTKGPEAVVWHQSGRWLPQAHLRSGPSARKLLQDAALMQHVVRLSRGLRCDVVVAHHVEAALACIAARAKPLIFYAHTLLGPELPTYFGEEWKVLYPWITKAGETLDRALLRRAQAVLAVSPDLSRALEERSGRQVHYAPCPWSVAPSISEDERQQARASFGFTEQETVVTYVGNLDRYQGWEDALAAVEKIHTNKPATRFLLGTDSELPHASALGVQVPVRFAPIASEVVRRRIYAAADIAVVPRRAEGGIPIKLLDGMARGIPVVTTRRATGGLSIHQSAIVVNDDNPSSLATGLQLLMGARALRQNLGTAGQSYITREHNRDAFMTAYRRAVDSARTGVFVGPDATEIDPDDLYEEEDP